ncbi:MAG: hormogonium polysaccharide biosynthesis protein HpsA [Tolypothrix carrinoi HA7290-LM1]|jgi:type II secretory pathway pseudopilin PulG|nr:hormogonium polysaccharide biosynthesis protein HpsA [Tolypothrix carrinoi HA7290-LM1]
MSSKRRLVKAIKILSRRFSKFSKKYLTAINKLINWLLRTLFITKRRRESANAGFVLPTVVMVALVVVLLTTAILFRSFERSQNASNVRVNQAVLNAATPAINRAKAKIEQLFNDPTLPRSTPSDGTLYTAFTKNIEKYTFGDEESLEVNYDINGNKTISKTGDLEVQEAVTTAWKFPVDTDNNGKYDSYILYGVFFRSPSRGNDGKFDRSRNPLDARTPPMDDGSLGGICAAAKGTSASLVGESGWYKSGATIKKSFFVYSTTVPITTAQNDKEEQYKGNKGFSALEYQQDQERIPIINNAVVYEDDLEITPGSGLNINGSIFTNSNLLTAKTSDGDIRFYQVSSPKSCFYQAQNSKITIGGNVGNGRISGEGEGSEVLVDLFKILPKDKSIDEFSIGQTKINETNKSANNKAGDIAYNTKAYAERINLLVETQTKQDLSNDPKEVQDNIEARIKENDGLDAAEVRRQELEAYFKKRTRRVPFAEVKLTDTAPTTVTLKGSGDKLRPPDEWINPTDTNTGLKLDPKKLPATEPNKLKETNKDEEKFVGDRIYAGNNLPALWYDSSKDDFFGKKTPQDVDPKTEWNDWKPNDKYKYRTRFTNVQDLISLSGTTDRDGYFEIKAAEKPKNVLDNVGGMRVVTGAGIYVDGDTSEVANASYRWDEDLGGKFRTSLKPRPTLDTNFVDKSSADPNKIKFKDLKFNLKDPIVVYPDSMPMAGSTGQSADKGDLQMRASAVYFYTDNSGKDNSGKDQVPIACVSSYYDPTNAVTAQNQTLLLTSWQNPNADTTTNGKSNNGVVYAAPYTSDSARLSAIGTYSKQLRQQARLVFPDGRLVNEPLRNALTQFDTDASKRSMADNSAIDTAVCAIQILGGATPSGSPLVPHGAIYETAFLDARQIKSIEKEASVFNVPNQDYTRSIEQRQPLEVRVTVLDLDKLRKVAIGNDGKKGTTESKQEYLLPNSGIIYATRDDALRDLSDLPSNNTDKRKLISPTDYKLDPTRRPNGIMLVKGENLVREPQYRDAEKGLILATNVPAYIKGDFNLHSKGGDKTNPVEEFTDQLRDKKTGEITWTNFYKRSSFDDDFACRKEDPRLPKGKCTMGDSWRPATVLADAVTILSDNFRFGFRDEGDYDLRNNQGDLTSDAYKTQGFFDNNFLTSSSWFNDSGSKKGYPKDDFDTNTPGDQSSSSYVNNFVTPIQRRVKFNEYLMEICPKVPVSTCTASDWSVDGAGKKATDEVGQDYKIAIHKAGTTVELADSSLRRYARRVAFARKPDGSLVLDEKGHPVPLGVDSSSPAKIEAFPNYKATITVKVKDKDTEKSYPGSATLPRIRPDTDPLALWYRTTKRDSLLDKKLPTDTNYGYKYPLFYQTIDGLPLKGTDANEQPLLVPVLQIHMPYDEWTKSGNDPNNDRDNLPEPKNRGIATDKNWLQIANATTSNLVIAGGDTPGRPTESNGGLENFVRYLESWKDSSDKDVNSNISGSLIQYKRSIYATAPWQAVQLDTSKNPKGETTLFGTDYPQYYRINSTTIGDDANNKGNGLSPFYKAPSRQWGFDVGLLSQLPDLFAQQFTIPPTTKPNEFFREVSRDDSWVQALLCAKTQDGKTNAVPDSERPKDFCKKNTDFN